MAQEKMSATIRDVARLAGTSTATVSKVMNGSYSISRETADRVRKAMDELDYHPNLRAKNFARQSARTIVFVAELGRNTGFSNDRLLEEKLIVILRGLAEEKLIATVDILKNMGMHFFELAIDNESELSMEKSLRNIEGLRKHYGDSIHIGAGTVINKLQVKRVAEIGGEYIISPNLNEEVVRATKEMGLVSIPGAATPSEIIRAYQAGADIVKVFPANYLGEAYIRAIKAPLDYIPIAAVGGIRPEDIPAFQSAGVSCFGVGKQLVDAGLFSSYCDEEVFQIIEDRAKRYLQAIR